MSPLQIRYARETELPDIVQLMINAFRGRAMNDAFFPESLRVNSGDADELDFRTRNMAREFDQKNRHHITVVDEGDRVLGYAEWTDGNDPVVDMTPEERDRNKAERIKKLPKSFDLQAAERVMREAEALSKRLKEALGKEGYKNSWSLNAIAVDPAYQRRGIGKMLTQWGLERAENECKNVHFLSSPSGAQLYRAMGFEQVGSGEILGGMEYAFVKRVTQGDKVDC